MITKLQK